MKTHIASNVAGMVPRKGLHAFWLFPVKEGRGWLLLTALLALFVLLPVVSIVFHASKSSGDLWPHLMAYVLPQALRDSLILLAGVGVIVVCIGSGAAWLVTAYDFPGRRLVSWALLLPLAVPSYIVAFAYLDLLHPIGPVQTALRDLLGYANPRDLKLPEIRSMGGCIAVLGLVLYPYVYIPVRALFMMQASGAIEAARTLGAGPFKTFARVALPLARPAIVVGASLALMEALNDIGAAEFLGVRTLTVSIYSTWVNRSSLAGAAQIALFMLAIVLALMAAERWARRHQRYTVGARQIARLMPRRLGKTAGWFALATVLVPVCLGFVFPALYLAGEAAKRLHFAGIERVLVVEILNTLGISAVATICIAALAFILAYTQRLLPHQPARVLVRSASLGYAIPGTVVAIGLLTPLALFDTGLAAFVQGVLGFAPSILISGSSFALVYAYIVRFIAIGNGSLEAGLSRIPGSLDHAARTLGASSVGVAWRIHAPLSRPAIGAALLLVFVDCMKELPATLLLRPLNFETLATHLYGEAARGTYESGAVAALLIVLVSLAPLALLSRLGEQARAPEPMKRLPDRQGPADLAVPRSLEQPLLP